MFITIVHFEIILQADGPMAFNCLTTVRHIAEHDPDRVLVAGAGSRLTAVELVDRVDRLAGWLGERDGQCARGSSSTFPESG